MRLQHERAPCYSARVVRVLRGAQARRKSSAIAYAHLGCGCSAASKNEIPSGRNRLRGGRRNPACGRTISASGVGGRGENSFLSGITITPPSEL